MEFYKSTNQIRTEVKNDFVYVRDLSEKSGVISALLNKRTTKKVVDVLENVTNETFGQVWDSLNKIKGVNFDYRSY